MMFFVFVYLQADDKNSRCLVHFEDDSKYWILFKDLLKGNYEDRFQVKNNEKVLLFSSPVQSDTYHDYRQ